MENEIFYERKDGNSIDFSQAKNYNDVEKVKWIEVWQCEEMGVKIEKKDSKYLCRF